MLRRGLGVVGSVEIPRDIWDRYVPRSFESVAGSNFSRLGSPSDEVVVMLRAVHLLSYRRGPRVQTKMGVSLPFQKHWRNAA